MTENQNLLVLDDKDRDRTDLIRGDVQDWVGGKKIDLDKDIKGGSVKTVLSMHLKATLNKELDNHKQLVNHIRECQKIYKGKRDPKTFPWVNCSNTATIIPRSNTDAIDVRVDDAIFNKQELFLFGPKGNRVTTDEEDAQLRQQQTAFNHYVTNELSLRRRLRSSMQQDVVSGTGIAKIIYEIKNHPFYDFADDTDKGNRQKVKYRVPGADPVVKNDGVTFNGPNVYAVDRCDFLISSDATNIDDAYLVAHRFYRRKQELKSMASRNQYYPDAVEKLTVDKFADSKKETAAADGLKMEKTPYEEPYELYECWFKYDVDGDGDEDDILVIFHLASGQILKAIYNPLFYGYRPFVAFVDCPQPFTFDGEGICGILKSLAHEVDTLHNQRMDRMSEIILPMGLYKAGVGLEDFKLTPGVMKPVDVDPSTVVAMIQTPDIPVSTVQEEASLRSDMDRAIGITAATMGVSTAERPVAKDTAVLAEEANKKIQQRIDNRRMGFKELGYKLLESFAQHQPQYTYKDEKGKLNTVNMPHGNIRDMIDLDLEVSSELMNMETRRELGIMKFQMVKQYSDSTMAMAQALSTPAVPSEFKKYILANMDVWNRLMIDVLANFDDKTPEKQTVNIKTAMDTNACIQKSADILAEQQAQAAAQQQGGQPGMGGPGGQVQPAGPGGGPVVGPIQQTVPQMPQAGTPGEGINVRMTERGAQNMGMGGGQ